tara:strand:+ start:288 stop:410 length:123 start_codon:yes stop_codon:yes gene_type:complete
MRFPGCVFTMAGMQFCMGNNSLNPIKTLFAINLGGTKVKA